MSHDVDELLDCLRQKNVTFVVCAVTYIQCNVFGLTADNLYESDDKTFRARYVHWMDLCSFQVYETPLAA